MLKHNVTLAPHGNTSQPVKGKMGPPTGGNISHPVGGTTGMSHPVGGNIRQPAGGNISQPQSATPHQNTLNRRLSRLVKRYGVDGNADV
jgi:hypothetical protein